MTAYQPLFLDKRAMQTVKSKLLAYPPRGPFAGFPLQKQLELVPFELTVNLQLEGLWSHHPDLEFPSLSCLLEEILLFAPDRFAVNRRALDALAVSLLEKANGEFLLTDDEVMQRKHCTKRIRYALRLAPQGGNQWLDMVGSMDMMQHPNELSRWIQNSVSGAFATAANKKELISQHKRLSLQLELFTEEQPFHLHLYMSSIDDGSFDLKEWHHYVVMINARARRQAAKNAFYGTMQLIRDHQNVPIVDKSFRPEKIQSLLTTEHRRAETSTKIEELRAKHDAAVLDVLVQFAQCTR